nr:deoxyribodipyrimidine photolyase [Candidatus Woesebacteria bacterium]
GCDGLSNFSPYLHFGQLSAQRVALRIRNSRHNHSTSAEKFLEELIVRRELAENFCFYNQNYDSTASYPEWALQTLREHEPDERLHQYTQEQLELAQTSDPLWNLAQQELRLAGKMHGYMRMYWAKQLLRWTKSVEEAQKLAIYLNDRYELDGRDPNGYAGIAWSLGGVHDRPWPAQPIFGKVRSMSYESTRKKINQESYEKRINNII